MTAVPANMVTREIPMPTSIGEVAQGKLAAMIAMGVTAPTTPPSDTAGWDALIQFANDMLRAMLRKPAPGTGSEAVTIGGIPCYDIDPHNRSSDRICLYLHGGALIIGAGDVGAAMSMLFAEGAQMRTIGVDYRMPPHHPYPTPLDDCVAAYRALLDEHDARDVVIGGQSGGGNLAAALTLRARDEGLPMPAAVILLTPEVDLTESGDSFETLLGVDPVASRLTAQNLLYAGGHDLADPYLSPLFGDFSKGFPPTFLQCGTRDLFLSNTIRFHRALRRQVIPAELHVSEAMPHGGFGSILEGGLGSAPEDREVYDELRRFLAALA